MADNYLQFSEAIDHLSIDEREWLERQLEVVYVFHDREYAENEIPADLLTGDLSWCGCRVFRDFPEGDTEDEAGFEYQFKESERLGSYRWIYAEEAGDPDRVAYLLQRFLRQFRPRESWALRYATTCSKPRLGEFGGGARFVTASGVESLDTEVFVSAREAADAP